jgi:hypothetical protein
MSEHSAERGAGRTEWGLIVITSDGKTLLPEHEICTSREKAEERARQERSFGMTVIVASRQVTEWDPATTPCEDCGGDGYGPDFNPAPGSCPTCRGTGSITSPADGRDGAGPMTAPDREGAAVEALARLLAEHDGYEWWPMTREFICTCEASLGTSYPDAAHRAHVAAVIAAGWVPESEVRELRERIDSLRDELGYAIRTRDEWEANASEAEGRVEEAEQREREAAAKALREAANEVRHVRENGLPEGVDSHPTAEHFEDWLRARAERIGEGE